MGGASYFSLNEKISKNQNLPRQFLDKSSIEMIVNCLRNPLCLFTVTVDIKSEANCSSFKDR